MPKSGSENRHNLHQACDRGGRLLNKQKDSYQVVLQNRPFNSMCMRTEVEMVMLSARP